MRAVIKGRRRCSTRRWSLLAVVVTHAALPACTAATRTRPWARSRRALVAPPHRVGRRPYDRVFAVMPASTTICDRGEGRVQKRTGGGRRMPNDHLRSGHVDEVSHVHGRLIDEIGYHCRDYFLGPVGSIQEVPGRHPRAFDTCEGKRYLRSRECVGASAYPGDARHRDTRRAVPSRQSRISRSRAHRSARLRGRSEDARHSARRRIVVSHRQTR